MDTQFADLDSLARAVGSNLPSTAEVRTLLGSHTIVFDGYGSIARPASTELARRGADRFVLTDPKEYVSASVHSQCAATEVGRRKVDVGWERLGRSGAQVTSFARDIAAVPEGVLTQEAIVIASFDNRRADIVSNRRAARMGVRLIKVNVEPALGVATVRAYDFRGDSSLCAECQFGRHHYATQRHPRSCDGLLAGSSRRTNSPRWLSQAAAHLAVLATLDLAADGVDADAWIGREVQYYRPTGQVTSSRLKSNANCRWDHADRWQNLVRLQENELAMSLRELFRAAEIPVDARAKIRFCQQVALRGRCAKCRTDVALIRWIADSQAALGPCPACGAPLLTMPFSIFSELSTEPLLAVMESQLGEWGVERAAVMEISRDDRRVSFVVGSL